MYLLKEYFKVGNVVIDNAATKGYKFIISKKEDLINVVFPHFDKYPLQGSKFLDYIDLKQAVYIVSGENIPSNFVEKLLLLKSKMNRNRTYEERWYFLKGKTFNLAYEWIQAFIDGEGTFQCRIAENISRNYKYIAVNPTLEIAQKSHDAFLLKAIIDKLLTGFLKPKYDIYSLKESKNSRPVSRAIFSKYEIIISFVDKYPMLTNKQLDYKDWKQIIQLKSEGRQKDEEGINEMIKLKLGMNCFATGRILNSTSFNIEDKRNIIKSLNDK